MQNNGRDEQQKVLYNDTIILRCFKTLIIVWLL